MENCRRLMCLVLSMFLLMGVIPESFVSACAEMELAQEMEASAEIETEAPEATAAELSEMMDEASAMDVELTETDAEQEAAFEDGYAFLSGGARIFAAAGRTVIATTAEKGVVYACGRESAEDCEWMQIVFARETSGAQEGWVRKADVCALTDNEIAAHVAECRGCEDVAYAFGDMEKPLLNIKCEQTEEKAEAAEMPQEGLISEETAEKDDGLKEEILLRAGETASLMQTEASGLKVEMLVEEAAPVEIFCGGTLQLTAERMYADVPEGEIVWRAEGECISVTEDGLLSAAQPGTGKVVAEAEGRVAYASVTVKDVEMTFDAPRSIMLGVGEKSEPIIVSYGEDAACSYGFKSMNTRYATVDARGVVKGVRTGKTTIIVKAHNGVEAQVQVTVKKAPSRVTVSPTKAVLGVDETLQLKTTLSSGASGRVMFDKYDAQIVSVSDSGLITALAEGTTKIRIATYNKRYAYCTVTVRAKPETVELNAETLTLGEGETFAFKSALNPGSAGRYVYSVDDGEVLRIDAASGSVRALSTGTVNVRVETYNGVADSCAVTVKRAPDLVCVQPKKITLGVGEVSQPLEITLEAEEGECAGGYSLKSSSTRYATVDGAGRIKGARAGKATVTVRTYNGKTAKVAVTVEKAPSKVTLNVKSAKLGVGETLALRATLPSKSAGRVTFASSDEAVLMVDENGSVTALGEGDAQITARTFNGKTAVCRIHVAKAPESVALDAAQMTLGVGETAALHAYLPEGSAGRCTFGSRDEAVAKVDAQSGKLKGIAPGTAAIYVETYNGHTAECMVTVKNAPEGVRLQEKSVTIAVGDMYQLAAPSIQGTDVSCADFSYAIGSSRYAKVDANGRIKGVRAGKTTVTVKTYNGKKASITVQVKAAPKSMKFDREALTLAVGREYQTKVAFTGGMKCSFALATSDENVVALAADGCTLRAKQPGSAVITATSYNGLKANMTVTVPELPQSIALEPGRVTLGVGDGIALRAIMPEGQDSLLTYASANDAVAAVDADGNVYAAGTGCAAVRVETVNGKSAECEITVVSAPTKVSFARRSALRSLEERSLQLEFSFGSPEEGGRYEISSSDPAVATVDQTGLVTFHQTGTVQIVLKTYNGLKAVCAVTVAQPPEEIRFEGEELLVALGDTIEAPVRFEAGGGSYALSVDDGSIAETDGERLTGRALGETTLTATSYNGLSASCRVHVVSAPEGIELDAAELKLYHGQMSALSAVVLPHGVGSYTFSSSDPAVAIVDAFSGQVTAVGCGDCVITASTYDGQCSAQCAVQVCGLLNGVKIGIDPGHQAKANMKKEAVAPGSSKTKYRVSGGAAGVSTRIPEHVTNLEVSLQLREALEALGAEVYMTRESANVDISNQQRAIMMNEYGADLVLRIHCNSYSGSHSGMSMWTRKTGIGKAESARAAEALLEQMRKTTGARSDGLHRSDSYTGLNWSTVPSVLVEMGYLSNSREDKLLNSAEYQAKLVEGMVNGICVFMDRPLLSEIDAR